jgi:hypothetical protein
MLESTLGRFASRRTGSAWTVRSMVLHLAELAAAFLTSSMPVGGLLGHRGSDGKRDTYTPACTVHMSID